MTAKDTAARIALAGAFVGGVSYLAAGAVATPPWVHTAWKGSGVALLAVYAALRARSLDGWLLCAVMALGAAGDVLLEVIGLTKGAVAFLAGHLVAIGLYARNLRPGTARPAAGLGALAFAAAVSGAAYALPGDRAAAPGVAAYALALGLMAATAWLSRFPRAMTGAGALGFVVSDLLIFAHGGPLAGQAWVSPAIWVLYFGGQALIVLGVARTLARGPWQGAAQQ